MNDHGLIPGLTLCACRDSPEPKNFDSRRKKTDTECDRYELVIPAGRLVAGNVGVAIECEHGVVHTDWYTVSYSILPAAEARLKRVYETLNADAELIVAVQQRLAVFTLLVIARRCRFVRWDRSGCIGTQFIDYYAEWPSFCESLWRVSQCTDVQLGLDPTAARLLDDDPDYKRMTQAAIDRDTDIVSSQTPVPTARSASINTTVSLSKKSRSL